MNAPPGRQRRPENRAPEVVDGQDDVLTLTPNKSYASRRLAWAVPLIRAGRAIGALPRYGDREWCALPDTDRRKIAATVVAAENYAVSIDPETIRRDLEDELDARRWAEHKIEREEWDRATATVRNISTAKSWAKVVESWEAS